MSSRRRRMQTLKRFDAQYRSGRKQNAITSTNRPEVIPDFAAGDTQIGSSPCEPGTVVARNNGRRLNNSSARLWDEISSSLAGDQWNAAALMEVQRRIMRATPPVTYNMGMGDFNLISRSLPHYQAPVAHARRPEPRDTDHTQDNVSSLHRAIREYLQDLASQETRRLDAELRRQHRAARERLRIGSLQGRYTETRPRPNRTDLIA